jgi:hypothetical protein
MMGRRASLQKNRERLAMLRIRRRRHKAPSPQTQQVVLAHQAQHPLGIDGVPALPQFSLHPPIPIEPLRHDHLLNGIPQCRVRLPRRRRFPMPLKSRAAPVYHRVSCPSGLIGAHSTRLPQEARAMGQPAPAVACSHLFCAIIPRAASLRRSLQPALREVPPHE